MTIGAFNVILDTEGRVLLCHRTDRDQWNLPGGGVDAHEAPWHAALRELQEELGVLGQIESFIGCYFKKEADDLVFMFKTILEPDQNFQYTDEADDFRFFPLSDLPENTAPKQRDRLLTFRDSAWPIFEIQ